MHEIRRKTTLKTDSLIPMKVRKSNQCQACVYEELDLLFVKTKTESNYISKKKKKNKNKDTALNLRRRKNKTQTKAQAALDRTDMDL